MRRVRLALILVAVGLFVGGIRSMDSMPIKASESSQVQTAGSKVAVQEPLEMEVVLQRVYIDGHVGEERKKETIWAMEDFWARYEGWELVDQQVGHITFRKEVDDLSPFVKEAGYFGLNEGNELILFDGTSDETQVIHSFFQIDVGKLESFQSQELQEGIKIKSKDQYLSLLKKYEYFSITPTP
ncbi:MULTISPECIES: intercompartmental signaling factor BofC [Pontibacillus]|uniref:Intercompartmental signaling factor BofC n=1 Tax=Pontibacillus chungwhensis TaxID=265426 RepID=A0ABY8UTT4_9BACI|nr:MULTISPECIES: intercompartmental signaling factor BofC [Pontibacillus]MCD5323706.1 intercompartmental signaling factor BofC [Pontibacillus sp. HN14]WIF97071.1 intercompartmental signaling factor BofC [Pontibacillus chungwhensis]